MDDTGASISAVGSALHEALPLQPVDRSGDGAARQQHLAPDDVDRKGAFVEQGLEHGEVGVAETLGLHVAPGVSLHGPRGAPQNQPNRDSARCVFLLNINRSLGIGATSGLPPPRDMAGADTTAPTAVGLGAIASVQQ